MFTIIVNLIQDLFTIVNLYQDFLGQTVNFFQDETNCKFISGDLLKQKRLKYNFSRGGAFTLMIPN